MKFELTPVLDHIRTLYTQPLTPARFKEYLTLLQGNTDADLALPIGGFNPMAKDHAISKIDELVALEAEQVMQNALELLNSSLSEKAPAGMIQVVLNLADDLKGGWTNRFTTDFDSKFKLNALVTRRFCTPYFWTSEAYSESLIAQRTLAYGLRTAYWMIHGKPKTLKDHVAQEVYVYQHPAIEPLELAELDLNGLENTYQEMADEDDYSWLFNFFYGDEASTSLGYPCFGITEATGFHLAAYFAQQ